MMDDFIRPHLIVFHCVHSTTLQLVGVTTHLTDVANRYPSTGAVLLDVSKAFNKVGHESLPFKMFQTQLPSTKIHFLWSYRCE